MPHARYNDRKMYLGSLQKWGKFKMLNFLRKFSSANHLGYSKFQDSEVTEVKLTPMMDSYYNIDGEIYPNDEVQVKLLPSYLTLIGRVHD